MPPTEEAKEVFRRLGYAVSGEGTELRADRKWRTVRVTALCADDAAAPDRAMTDGGSGEADDRLRCFVTWMECTQELFDYLDGLRPGYEWAVIGVDDSGEFEVVGRDAVANA